MTVIHSGEPNAISSLKCELAVEVLRSSGRLRLQVTGWSMLPSVFPEDTLMIERVNKQQVSTGDIILFHRERRLFAHRVVANPNGASDALIVTQGDGMARPDVEVSEAELMGKVSFIVRKGRLLEPGKTLPFPKRAVAALVRRSPSAARFVAGVHAMRRNLPEPVDPWHY